ncbi:DNA-3-methyladenine glycosylase I [Nonlabens sp. Asnod3-H03]|uniref:DNA-3-methyladenine glycosylase I n=1 Tax=Nonlabens ulvanivorans TaxID=906888 RepID=A0A081D7T2_NONUL|nr:DNA-3-methyladenine glycosylase I [Nonlabens ulvanivorans]GAK74978.1 DNA-3-methyladenine glycosylase [Nonlabens ulvanivorans]
MEKHRCGWCLGDDLYEAYHDLEWGKPVYDDQTLFEFLILETMQAGLSWITILKKRANYYDALDQFDVQKIANYNQNKQDELLMNAGIIRNKLKIKSIITNAQLFMEIQKEFGSFSQYIWNYVDGKPIKNQVLDYKTAPANTALSDQISKDLKKRGFKFVGSTIMYAFMQATGMVNDHEINCHRYDEV